MITINEVDLTQLGFVLPHDKIGIVSAQPLLSLSNEEPFRTPPDLVQNQIQMIQRVMAVAKTNPHDLDRTHLTIFPEYSVPGIQGVTILRDIISLPDWPNSTLVIAGIDGLTRNDYEVLTLQQETYTHQSNSADKVREYEWVNCSVVFAKCADGSVKSWIQPKIHPAWEEQEIRCERMFHGRSINLFKGRLTNGVSYRLCTLICYDWIATIGPHSPIDWVIHDLEQRADDAQLPLTWAVVIENNPKPSHNTFLGRIAPFFDQRHYPKVLRSSACVIFANTAGSANPGKVSGFGGTSAIFSGSSNFKPSENSPSVCKGGPRFRDGSDLLGPYHDSFFRERGACIHSFVLVNPYPLTAGPTGRSYAVDNAQVFSCGEETCPRVPNGPVPASVKWINDELDAIESIAECFSNSPLAPITRDIHIVAKNQLRQLSGQDAAYAIEIACQANKKVGPDGWSKIEEDGLTHICETLDVVGTAANTIKPSLSRLHGLIEMNDGAIELLAITDVRHEVCLEKSRWVSCAPGEKLLVVTRDRLNSLWNPQWGSYLETDREQSESRYTFPSDDRVHMGFQNLLTVYRSSKSREEFVVKLNGEING